MMFLIKDLLYAKPYPDYPYIFHGPIPISIPIVTEKQLNQALSPVLSTLCSVGCFNQSVRARYFGIALLNDGSRYYLGYAKMGFNLYDPDNMASSNNYYLFDYDGTGTCRVYAFLLQS